MKLNPSKHCCLILLVFCASIFNSCQKETNDFLQKSKYIFLEQHKHTNSELLEGMCEHLCIDFPMYSFDPSTGILVDYAGNVKVNLSLKMVLATGVSLSGDAGSGAASGAEPIAELPYEKYNIKINKFDPDGTVYFFYNDSSFVLGPNEEWKKITTEIKVKASWYDYIRDTTGTIKYTTVDRIKNWGLLDKSGIVETEMISY